MTITQMIYTQAIVHLWTQTSPFEIYYLWSSMFNLVCITAKYPRGTFIIFSVISKISHFPIIHYLINKCTIIYQLHDTNFSRCSVHNYKWPLVDNLPTWLLPCEWKLFTEDIEHVFKNAWNPCIRVRSIFSHIVLIYFFQNQTGSPMHE